MVCSLPMIQATGESLRSEEMRAAEAGGSASPAVVRIHLRQNPWRDGLVAYVVQVNGARPGKEGKVNEMPKIFGRHLYSESRHRCGTATGQSSRSAGSPAGPMRTLQASVIDVRHGLSITSVAHPCHLTWHMTVNHGQ